MGNEPPPPPKLSGGAGRPADGRKPFAVQAAQFSLYAVPAALVLGFCANVAEKSVARHLGMIGSAAVAAGFALGVAALFAMRRTGPKGVLVRATVGVLMNGAVLAGVAYWYLRPVGPTAAQLAGRWSQRLPGKGFVVTEVLTFNPDGTFRQTYDNGYSTYADFTGTWSVKDGQLSQDFLHAAPGAPLPFHHGPSGSVRVTGDGELVVANSHQELHYFRK